VKAPAISTRAIERALVRFPNWLGDTVLALPTLRALRGALPGAELWCLGPWVGSILETEIGVARRLVPPRRVGARLAQARRLRQARFDLALILPNSFETGLAGWLSGARWRVGYGEGRSRLLTHPVPSEPQPVHQVTSYLRLLAPLGVKTAPAARALPMMTVDTARRIAARRLLEEAGVTPGAPRVGLQLGAGLGPAKLWPPERIAQLATRLEARGARAVLLGAPQATGLAEAVQAAASAPIRSLVGRDSPALLPALVAELDVLVGADSGPAHVAAAVGVPAVTLFGPTDPRLTAPLGVGQQTLWHQPACGPCFLRECPIDHRCLLAIEVAEVETAVMRALEWRR
jgi:lipopolysaccharide heptosyltransferase II